MNILVIVAHPRLGQSRVNRTWAERLKQVDGVTVHDVYAAYPEGTIDAQRERELLLAHDRIVVQYPFYWYSAPAFFKLWMEDVLEAQWLMGGRGRGLAGKELILAISAGSQKQAYQAGGFQQYTVSELTKPMQAMAGLIGMTFLPSFVFYGAAHADDEAVRQSADAYAAHILDPNLDPRRRLLQAISE
ncbi:NAD(P)H-dependent oxidoreductase [Paenibacillus chartarius]|uniref:NAD(P)H-dependent oxidoreductase n=1 Tax=Paenibacillus chartarius TaxID=747481 RepID=A0ABV6DRP0_9BACL